MVIALNALLAVTAAASTMISDKTTYSTLRRPRRRTLAGNERTRRKLSQTIETPMPRTMTGMKT
jgi:hypothetical protein